MSSILILCAALHSTFVCDRNKISLRAAVKKFTAADFAMQRMTRASQCDYHQKLEFM